MDGQAQKCMQKCSIDLQFCKKICTNITLKGLKALIHFKWILMDPYTYIYVCIHYNSDARLGDHNEWEI